MKKIIMIIVFVSCAILYPQYYLIDEWYLVDKTDPITDEKSISIFIKKQEENSLNFNTLMIQIKKDSININLYTPSLVFKQRFNDNDKIDIIYRLDKNVPRTNSLNKYGEGEYYSLNNNQSASQQSIILLKELLSHNTLAVRAVEKIDNANHTYTYVYDLNRLRELLKDANLDNTILENSKAEIDAIIIQETEKAKEEEPIVETEKTNHRENIYMIDDINYNPTI
ncbi:hypothetical protein [Brachyspira pulli]|uniref:hypothetical protein n=1 Tax=Brachyspira pulli TaxID=310721 RepID=UPI00300422E8